MLPRVGLGEIELSRSLGPQAMVDAVRHDREPEFRREADEHREEGHRVRTAAHRHEDRRSGRHRALALEGATNDRREGRADGGPVRHPSSNVGGVAPPVPLVRTATVSTWLVCGNISKVSADASTQPPARRVFTSRASVGGSHET